MFQVHRVHGAIKCSEYQRTAPPFLFEFISDQRSQTVSGRAIRADAEENQFLFMPSGHFFLNQPT